MVSLRRLVIGHLPDTAGIDGGHGVIPWLVTALRYYTNRDQSFRGKVHTV